MEKFIVRISIKNSSYSFGYTALFSELMDLNNRLIAVKSVSGAGKTTLSLNNSEIFKK